MVYHSAFDPSKGWRRALFAEDVFLIGQDMNDLQNILGFRASRLAEAIFGDGDIVEDAEISIDTTAQTATIAAGLIYLQGWIYQVPEIVGLSVPNTGERKIGVVLTSSVSTGLDDTDILGPEPGTRAHDERGADREVVATSWAVDYTPASQDETFHTIYRVVDGVVLDTKNPPQYDDINRQIAQGINDANGSFIVESGWIVTYLTEIANQQQFSISEGRAYINGYRRTRTAALRHTESINPDTRSINNEPQSFADGGTGTATITVNHPPINSVQSVTISKDVTRPIVRGPVANTADALPDTPVRVVHSVTQGPTTYIEGTDYNVVGDTIDWSPAGDEPAPSSTYDVNYEYFDTVVTGFSFSDTQITISGGVTDSPVIIDYTQSLPRVDLIVANQDGSVSYVKGISQVFNPQPPPNPKGTLELAQIWQKWYQGQPPDVRQTGTISMPFAELRQLQDNFYDLADLVARNRLEMDMAIRQPTSSRGMFVDPFFDGRFRDAGIGQSLAVFGGFGQLPLDVTITDIGHATLLLPYTDEVIVDQPLTTSAVDINPYDSFSPLPQTLEIIPPVDNWVEEANVFGNQTLAFQGGNGIVIGAGPGQWELQNETRREAEFLRERDIDFTARDFGPGETAASVTFDGIDVTPDPPPVADGNGVMTGTITIPPNVSPGRKVVVVTGDGPSEASTIFQGQGTVISRTFNQIAQPPVAARPAVQPPPPAAPFIPDIDFLTFNLFNQNLWGGADPQAQSFRPPTARMITGISARYEDIGDPNEKVVVQLRANDAGVPGPDVINSVDLDMTTVTPTAWTKTDFDIPTFLVPDEGTWIVWLTNDPDHSICNARLGDYDANAGEWVTRQPYQVGVRASSSNGESWTVHNTDDVTFRVHAAAFTSNDVTTELATIPVVNMSDFCVRTIVTIPDASCRIEFIIERAGHDPITCWPNQNVELDAYYTGDVVLKARLVGSAHFSPILWNGTQFLAGELQTTGDYQSRKIDTGTNARVQLVYEAILPAGGTIVAEIEDEGGGSFTTIPIDQIVPVEDNWREFQHVLPDHTNTLGAAIRLNVTGDPANRVWVRNLRCNNTD